MRRTAIVVAMLAMAVGFWSLRAGHSTRASSAPTSAADTSVAIAPAAAHENRRSWFTPNAESSGSGDAAAVTTLAPQAHWSGDTSEQLSIDPSELVNSSDPDTREEATAFLSVLAGEAP